MSGASRDDLDHRENLHPRAVAHRSHPLIPSAVKIILAIVMALIGVYLMR